ncbi:hypothetical protein MNBD_GAMMA16-1702 [hydrothermal vent metagenome]|uniref:Uncharacterized protein n=1 Tax=hydrothermal vent metagenome TaxID=652676 RepID=A0A3B0ZZA2_9ZZZZ
MAQIPETGEDIPKWDVALEALTREECKKSGAALDMNDFKRLAQMHSIRFDDIMVTMFELVLNNKWSYQSSDKDHHRITQDEVNRLYVNGRLKNEDVATYTGQWKPTPDE